jgi:hypothetical protein
MLYLRGILIGSILCYVSGCSTNARPQAEWLNLSSLTAYLLDQQSVSVPVSQVLKDEAVSEICVLDSYQFELSPRLSEVQCELEQATLMPVAEGDGLVITIDQNKLDEVSVFSVWSADLILESVGQACYAKENAFLNIRKDEFGTIRFSISGSQ